MTIRIARPSRRCAVLEPGRGVTDGAMRASLGDRVLGRSQCVHTDSKQVGRRRRNRDPGVFASAFNAWINAAKVDLVTLDPGRATSLDSDVEAGNRPAGVVATGGGCFRRARLRPRESNRYRLAVSRAEAQRGRFAGDHCGGQYSHGRDLCVTHAPPCVLAAGIRSGNI